MSYAIAPRRSEFARHFGPAALRRETLRRFGVEVTPCRVGRDDPDLTMRALQVAIAPIRGGRLVAAWAARALAVTDNHTRPDGGISRITSEVWVVCVLYAGGVVWGAVRLGGAVLLGGAYAAFREMNTIYIGRATGPAFLALAAPSDPIGPAVPARLYATNDAGECPICGAACRAWGRIWSANRDAPYPCGGNITAHEDADRYTYPLNNLLPGAGDLVLIRASEHAPLRGLRRASGRVLPPARLAAGVAHYRDAPRLASATARLGRRGPAAHRYSFESEVF